MEICATQDAQAKNSFKKEKRYRQPNKDKDWKEELIDKASLIYICTSECRYWPKASIVLVEKQQFTDDQLKLLTLNHTTLSMDGEYYVCKPCRNTIKRDKIPPCNELTYKFTRSSGRSTPLLLAPGKGLGGPSGPQRPTILLFQLQNLKVHFKTVILTPWTPKSIQ